MPRKTFALVTGLFWLLTAFAGLTAAQNAPASGDWYVISKAGADNLQRILPLERDLGEGWRIGTVETEKDRVRLCLQKGKDKKQCAQLHHPGQSFPGAHAVGTQFSMVTGDVKQPSPGWPAVEAALAKVGDGFWVKVKREDSGPIGSNSGWAQALWYLLEKDETKLATRLVEAVESQNLHARTRQLFKALIAGQEGRMADAVKILDELGGDEANDAHIQMVRGRIEMLNGNIDEGAERFAKSVANLPAGLVGRCVPANAVPELLAARKLRDKAGSAWDALIARMPDCENMLLAYTDQLLAWGRTDQALDVLNKRLEKTPEDTDVLFQKVAVLRRQRKALDAMKLLDHINSIKPNIEPVISLHSTLASSLQEFDAYRQKMLKRATDNPDDLFAVHAAGVMSYYGGEYETAIRLMDSLKDRLPNNARVHIYRSMARYQTGDWEGAKKGLMHLLDVGTEDPDIYYCLAMLYSTKDTETSRRYLEEYLAVPHHPDAVAAKQQRAWHEWKLLGEGKTPPEWVPGAEHTPWDQPTGGADVGDGIPPQLVLGITAAIALLAGGLLGLSFGRRRKG